MRDRSRPTGYGVREKSHDPWRAQRFDCDSGKIGYVSKSAAKRAIKAGRRDGGGHCAVYKCGRCGVWHTTSQEQW